MLIATCVQRNMSLRRPVGHSRAPCLKYHGSIHAQSVTDSRSIVHCHVVADVRSDGLETSAPSFGPRDQIQRPHHSLLENWTINIETWRIDINCQTIGHSMKKNTIISSTAGSSAPRFPIIVLTINNNNLSCNYVETDGYRTPISMLHTIYTKGSNYYKRVE
jgi:hypothetical protein